MKHTVRLADGRIVPAIGLGTWYLGENPVSWHRELEALRTGIKEGMTLIDTAEMYGSGRSERLVGEAISGMTAKVFLWCPRFSLKTLERAGSSPAAGPA